jgi:hypothetical protein
MYDAEKAIAAWTKCTLDFEPDSKFGIGVMSGKMFDILDYKLYNWPGHGVSLDLGFQYVEGEYMKAGEYDALIRDPSDYWLRAYLPRTVGALEPLATLPSLVNIIEIVNVPMNVSRFGAPGVLEAFEKLAAAGREAINWQNQIGPADKRLEELGYPSFASGMTKAPFDTVGDTLRGTRAVIVDMFRQPEKLLEALERTTPLMIQLGLSGARLGGSPVVMIPLHKGADGWMSDEQFNTFYWPTLRRVVMGLIEEGIVPRLFAEGGYNSRLEVIRDLPKGKTIWHFDYTDMARAKEVLGDVACIMGNVPVALMHAGTPEGVIEYCKKLIAKAGNGGGFIMTTGAGLDQAKTENVQALMKAAKEYGVY